MAKTYGTVTTFTAGSVLTAAQLNVASTAVNNLIVPPMCQVRRTTTVTGYSSTAAISWESSAFDTDGMYSSGSPTRITIQTAGIYVVSFVGGYGGAATITRALPIVFKNGSGAGLAQHEALGVSIGGSFAFSFLANFAASDYLTAGVLLSGGSAYTIGGNTTEDNSQTRLTVQWIGRTS